MREWEIFTGKNGKGIKHSWTPRKPNHERRNLILSLSQQGLTAQQIGERLNPRITPSAVRSMLARLKTTTRQSGKGGMRDDRNRNSATN